MKFKKIIATLLTSVMAFSLVACSSSGGDTASANKKTDKKITIWAWDENFNIKAANVAKELYEKENPEAKVEVVGMTQEDIVQKLHASLSSGTQEGLPNVVLIEDYKIPGFLKAYPDQFKDLTGKIDESKFMDYKIKSVKDGDKVYGVPFDSGVASLFYRTDYVEQAGYKKEDMKNITWDKYVEIGKAVKEKTGKDMLTLNPSNIGELRTMMQSAGSWYVKEDGKTVSIADNQALKDSIVDYKKIVDAGIVKQVSDWDSFVSAFQKGDVATVIAGCWIAPSIQKAEDQSGKWGVVPIPRLASNSKSINSSNQGGSSWYVLDKVGDSELAADFLSKTFGSSTDLMNTLVKDINLVSTLKDSSKCENYNKPSEFFGGQEIFKEFSDWTTKVPPVSYGLHTYEIEGIVAEGLQKIMSGEDMEKTLQNTQQQAEAAVK